MKKFYVVYFLFLIVSFSVGLLTGYQWNQKGQDVADNNTNIANIIQPTTQGTEIESTEQEEFEYYLSVQNGLIVVYKSDKITIFEETDIRLEHLPQDLQVEILNGKGMDSEADVYDFLESYSS